MNSLVEPYIVRAVESEESIWREGLATSCTGMAYLEERVYRETLVQFRSETGEGEIVEKDSS